MTNVKKIVPKNISEKPGSTIKENLIKKYTELEQQRHAFLEYHGGISKIENGYCDIQQQLLEHQKQITEVLKNPEFNPNEIPNQNLKNLANFRLNMLKKSKLFPIAPWEE